MSNLLLHIEIGNLNVSKHLTLHQHVYKDVAKFLMSNPNNLNYDAKGNGCTLCSTT